MTKTQAISLFGKRAVNLADAVNRKKSAISQWPETLNEDQINLVVGAAVRRGISIPKEFNI